VLGGRCNVHYGINLGWPVVIRLPSNISAISLGCQVMFVGGGQASLANVLSMACGSS
jgi:hypothetical protein